MRSSIHAGSFIAPLSRLVVLTAGIREMASRGQRTGLVLDKADEAIHHLHRLSQTRYYPSEALQPDQIKALLKDPRSTGDGLGALEGVVRSFQKRVIRRQARPSFCSSHWQLAAMSLSDPGDERKPKKLTYVEKTDRRWKSAKDEEIRASIAKRVQKLVDREALNDLLDLIAWVPHDRIIAAIREAFEEARLAPFLEALLVDPDRILEILGVDRKGYSPSDRFKQSRLVSSEKDHPPASAIREEVPPYPVVEDPSQIPAAEPVGGTETEILYLAATVSDLDQLRGLVKMVVDSLAQGTPFGADLTKNVMVRVLERIFEKKVAGRKDLVLYTDYQIQKLRESLYAHNPAAAVTAWHKLTGYGWIIGSVKFDQRFEGVLASLRWLAERERESREEKEKTADSYWERETSLRGREPTVPSGYEHPRLQWWEKQTRAFGGQLTDRSGSIHPESEKAWKAYLDDHSEIKKEVEDLAASSLPASSEMARAVLKMVQ